MPITYAATAQGSTRPEVAEVLARGLNSDKQLLIYLDKSLAGPSPIDLTEKDLVAKANTALELMRVPSNNKPSSIIFIAAMKMHNGNVIYQLNSTHAAVWLYNTEVQKAFLLTYSSMANI